MAHSPQLFCRWTEGWSHTPCQGKHSMGEHLSKRQISQGKLHRALGLPGELLPSLIILAEKLVLLIIRFFFSKDLLKK